MLLQQYSNSTSLVFRKINLQKQQSLFFNFYEITKYFNFHKKIFREIKKYGDCFYFTPEILMSRLKKVLHKVFLVYYFQHFSKNLELLLSKFFYTSVFLNFNFVFQDKKPYILPILSAKIVSDLCVIRLESKWSVHKVYSELRYFQKINYKYREFLEKMYFLFLANGIQQTKLAILEHYSFKKYPVLGLRIECSGTSKKGKRKRKWFYGDWIKNYDFVQQCAPTSVNADVDYFQTIAVTPSCALGLKTWVFFKTHVFNNSKNIISLLVNS